MTRCFEKVPKEVTISNFEPSDTCEVSKLCEILYGCRDPFQMFKLINNCLLKDDLTNEDLFFVKYFNVNKKFNF